MSPVRDHRIERGAEPAERREEREAPDEGRPARAGLQRLADRDVCTEPPATRVDPPDDGADLLRAQPVPRELVRADPLPGHGPRRQTPPARNPVRARRAEPAVAVVDQNRRRIVHFRTVALARRIYASKGAG